jgi:hypothetical protein
MALRNARSFAKLKEPKLTGGWLQTAWGYGGLDLDKILQEAPFLELRTSSEFEEFIKKLK